MGLRVKALVLLEYGALLLMFMTRCVLVWGNEWMRDLGFSGAVNDCKVFSFSRRMMQHWMGKARVGFYA